MKYITDDYSFGDIAEMISDISSLPIEKRLPKIFDLYDRFIAGDQDDFYFRESGGITI